MNVPSLQPRDCSPSPGEFWAQVLTFDGTTYYSWVEVLPISPATFMTMPGGRFGTVLVNPIREANGSPLALNTYVRVTGEYFDTTYDRVYLAVYGTTSGAFSDPLVITEEDAVTATTTTLLTLTHNSTGTPAAGFGTRKKYALESSTTVGRDAQYDDTYWITATDGTRTAGKKTWLVDDATMKLVQDLSFDNSYLYSPSTIDLQDAVTNAVSTVETQKHGSSGTPAAGFGVRATWQLDSATVDTRDAAYVDIVWLDPVDATRTVEQKTYLANAGAPTLVETLTPAGSELFSPLALPVGTTARASLRTPHGVAPTVPVNGDIWTTTLGIFARINGATQQLDAAAAGAGGAANSIQYNNAGALGGFGLWTPGTSTFQLDSAGDARGANAVDLQTLRSNVNQVATGQYSFIGGGTDNRNDGAGSVIGGGYGNYIGAGSQNFIGGGQYNIAGDTGGGILGGDGNEIISGDAGVMLIGNGLLSKAADEIVMGNAVDAGDFAVVALQGRTSTTKTHMAFLETYWNDLTHATYKAGLTASVTDSAGTREAWSAYADGTVVRQAWFAATPVIQQTGDVATALVALGLMSGTPTVGKVLRLIGTTSAPTVAITAAGAGANATTSVTGTDLSGTIELITSALDTPLGNNIIVTLTFNTTYAAAPRVLIMPANDVTWNLAYGIARTRQGDVTTTTFTIRSGTTPLTALTAATYQWNYTVSQ